MGKFRKRVKYDELSTSEGNYNATHDKSLYEVEYPDGSTEQLADNIIAENISSLVDSEGQHYQVLIEFSGHKKYYSTITKVDGFIKSISGGLHRKRTTRGWKL